MKSYLVVDSLSPRFDGTIVERTIAREQTQIELLFAHSIELISETTLEVWETAPANSDIEPLPAKKDGIDRLSTGSQNCDGDSYRCQQDHVPQVVSAFKGDAELSQRYKRAGDWSPQPDEKKYCCDGCDYLQRN